MAYAVHTSPTSVLQLECVHSTFFDNTHTTYHIPKDSDTVIKCANATVLVEP